MPLQNRVTPWGTIIATPERGHWFGNRGCLHDATGRLRRDYATTRWIFCELHFRGRRRPLSPPGGYTGLFFLDEATALAAGHRPCAECMRPRYDRFRGVWSAANRPLGLGPRPRATELDAVLHAERRSPDGTRRVFSAAVANLPNGAMVRVSETAGLVWAGDLWQWSPGGYAPWPGETPVSADVLTPESVVRALAGGYVPQVALAARGGE